MANLSEYRIKSITDNRDGSYGVESCSGNTYTVKSRTRLDEDGCMYFEWTCNCPARKQCRHIDAVIDTRWEQADDENDYDGMDIMEREV